jgi:hypothetical protein
MSKRRCVATGVPGATGSGTTKGADGGGDPYELCPDLLRVEPNGAADSEEITALLKQYRARKR